MATNKVVSTADIIAKSIDIFGPKGEHWITGYQDDGHGNYCMFGAISKAGRELHAPMETVQKARSEVTAALPSLFYSIPDFNDSRRTYAPIRRVMCKALKSALKAAERK